MRAFFAGLTLALTAGALAVDVGGLPSRPAFQQVTINQATTNGNSLILNAAGPSNTTPLTFSLNGAPTAAIFPLGAAGVGCTSAVLGDFCIRTVGGAVRISVDSGASSNPVAVITTAVATGTIVGCTTTPSVTINYTRVGNLVVGHFVGSASCTSNSAGTSITTAIPVAMEAVSSQNVAMNDWVDNGVGVAGYLNIPAGGTTITVNKLGSAAWTTTGSKGYNLTTFSYQTN